MRYNIFNLLACRCGGNVWYGPIGLFLYWSFGFIDLFILSFLYWNFPKLRQIIENLANSQDKILNSLENFASNNPFAFLYHVTAWLYGESEWIFSIGLLGAFFLHNLNFTRVSNCAFTGLKIHLADGSTFFFGSSLLLEVG